jgi:hypothetical protein
MPQQKIARTSNLHKVAEQGKAAPTTTTGALRTTQFETTIQNHHTRQYSGSLSNQITLHKQQQHYNRNTTTLSYASGFSVVKNQKSPNNDDGRGNASCDDYRIGSAGEASYDNHNDIAQSNKPPPRSPNNIMTRNTNCGGGRKLEQ